MPAPAPPLPVEALVELAIRHVNAGQPDRARQLCELAAATAAPHPAVLQLLAVLSLQRGDAAAAVRHAAASLALRPGHPPTIAVAVDAGFAHSLALQDAHDLEGAATALREVLRLRPEHVQAQVNLGIVLQDAGEVDAALQCYGRAYRLRADTFGRIAHALAAAPAGRLFLDLGALRRRLATAG